MSMRKLWFIRWPNKTSFGIVSLNGHSLITLPHGGITIYHQQTAWGMSDTHFEPLQLPADPFWCVACKLVIHFIISSILMLAKFVP